MLTVALETPHQSEVVALLAMSDAYAASLYPPEDRYMVDADFLASPNVRFLVARWQGKAVGCGALVLGSDGTAEVKRVVVDPDMRGKGVGRALMQDLEAAAKAIGVRRVQLEAGVSSLPALRLYRGCGYRERGPFGTYRDSPNSLFFERDLELA